MYHTEYHVLYCILLAPYFAKADNQYDHRGDVLGKRFGRLKKSMGFVDGAQVFHSIRKTLITLMENAGVSEGVAADIVGHEKLTIMYGLYSMESAPSGGLGAGSLAATD